MGKHDNMVIPRECEYSVSVLWYGGGDWYERTAFAKSRGAAKYQFWKDCVRDELLDGTFSDFCRVKCKIKKIGTPVLKSLYGDKFELERVCDYRSIRFAYLGMKVHLTDKGFGYITGACSGCNIGVYFPKDDNGAWCHPYWELTYFDDDDNVIKCYKKDK